MDSGDVLLDIFFNSRGWVNRKVHIVDHLVAGRMQTKVNLDLSIPPKEQIPQTENTALALPVALLNKGIIRSWWIEECKGSPLPVLGRDESTRLVRDMFRSLLKRVELLPHDNIDLGDLLSFIDNSSSSLECSMESLQAYLDENSGGVDPALVGLVKDIADLLSSSWIVFIEIPDSWVAGRRLIEYGYDDFPDVLPRPSLWKDNDYYELSLPDPGFARSQHYEIRVPPELLITETALQIQTGKNQAQRIVVSNEGGGCIAKIPDRHFDKLMPRFGQAKLYYRLQPARQGILPFTQAVTAATVLLVLLTIWIRYGPLAAFLQSDWYESTSVSVILAAPALLLSWVARAPEAAVVGRALMRLRWINIVHALTMLAMAAALSTHWSAAAWSVLWWFVYLSMAFALLLWGFEVRQRRNKLAT